MGASDTEAYDNGWWRGLAIGTLVVGMGGPVVCYPIMRLAFWVVS